MEFHHRFYRCALSTSFLRLSKFVCFTGGFRSGARGGRSWNNRRYIHRLRKCGHLYPSLSSLFLEIWPLSHHLCSCVYLHYVNYFSPLKILDSGSPFWNSLARILGIGLKSIKKCKVRVKIKFKFAIYAETIEAVNRPATSWSNRGDSFLISCTTSRAYVQPSYCRGNGEIWVSIMFATWDYCLRLTGECHIATPRNSFFLFVFQECIPHTSRKRWVYKVI